MFIEHLTVHVLSYGLTMDGSIAIDVHRAKFQQREDFSVESYALLTKEDRPFRIEFDHQGDHSHHNQKGKKDQQGKHDIEYAFCTQVARVISHNQHRCRLNGHTVSPFTVRNFRIHVLSLSILSPGLLQV